MQLEPALDINVMKTISVDIVATLGFLLEGEPLDMLSNCSTNGLELWRRLEARYNLRTDAKELNDMSGVLSPEPAKKHWVRLWVL